MKGKNRQSNFEVLRIIAMLMVVTLHYLTKGGVLAPLSEDLSAVNLTAWLIQSACIVAVNIYVLISGYFLIETPFRLEKLLRILIQVHAYAILIPLVCFSLGMAEVREWDIYQWIATIFPIEMEYYWFATAYIIMYLLSPLLSIAVKKISKKEFEIILLLLFSFFSFAKSLIPVHVPTDKYGYDFGWFLCLYLLAAYIRLYGFSWFNRIRKGMIIYLISVITNWGYTILLAVLSRHGLPLTYAMDMNHSYNHILVLIASVGLFYCFKYMRFSRNSFCGLAGRLAPFTFGVYLFHENAAIRDIWHKLAGVAMVKESFLFLPHMVITVLIVFTIGILIDYMRACIFAWLERIYGRLSKRGL